MKMVYSLFLLVLLSTTLGAKQYEISILLDKNSSRYIEGIRQETKDVFFKEDSINYHINICKDNCYEKLSSEIDIAVFKASKKIKNKNTYLINYNNISSFYDQTRVIKATSLAIYEFLKESKIKSVFLRNTKIFFEKEKKNDSLEVLELVDLNTYIKQNNYDYIQNKNSQKLDFLEIQEAKSSYKPKVTLFSNYSQIDEDRAKYSQGQYPQKKVSTGIKLKQLIYSNQAIKNIKIKRLLYKASKQGYKAQDDETLYRSVLLYLNIIKAKEQKKIINIKRDFILKNLVFSKQRVKIGVQDRSDVFRWQSELANANIQLQDSKKQLQELKLELLNNLGLEDNYSFVKYDMSNQVFKLLAKDAINYLKNQRVQEAFFDYLIDEHPMLKELQEILFAKKEQIAMNKQSYYTPKLAFQGSYKKYISKEGQGANINTPWDDKEFEAVLNLSFDLYDSSLKDIKLQKTKLEYINLKLSYKKLRDLIAKNVKTNYYFLEKSYKNISYSKNSLISSKKNLDLIQDKYKNGKSNIIELLDAQNSYIVSKSNHNISVTKYLENLVSIYFFIGKIDLLVDKSIKRDVENKIESIIKDK